MTNCEIIYDILLDKEWHNIIEISRIGFPNCINVAIRSRICDLKNKIRDKGLTIISEIDQNRCAKYKLEKIGQLELTL